MIDKVRKLLGLSSRRTGKKLILSVEKLESRVAVLENGRLEEYSVERKTSRNIVGGVYKGKVKNIEMGLKAMFVDIGFEKNAFLHFWDAIPAALDSGIEEIDRRGSKRPRKRITVKDIPSIYPVGSDVIVQVTWLTPAHKANPLQLIKSVAYNEKGGNLGGEDEETADQSQTATAQMASTDASPDVEPEADSQGKVRRRDAAVARAVPAATPASRNFFQRIFGMRPRQAPAPPPPPSNRRRGTPPR